MTARAALLRCRACDARALAPVESQGGHAIGYRCASCGAVEGLADYEKRRAREAPTEVTCESCGAKWKEPAWQAALYVGKSRYCGAECRADARRERVRAEHRETCEGCARCAKWVARTDGAA